MGEDFNTAALAAVGASVLLVVTYVLRLLEFQSDEPDRTVRNNEATLKAPAGPSASFSFVLFLSILVFVF